MGKYRKSASLSGKVVLLTGATAGIGLEAAVELARMEAQVVIVGRDPGRGARALEQIKERSGSQKVELMLCDFASQQQIRDLAAAYRARHDRLDILINNAGSVNARRRITTDGIEQTFAANHLGYFLLTNLLLDLIEKSAPARIVNVASTNHRQGKMNFADLNYERGVYFLLFSYARSKLGNVLFTRELAKRLQGKGVTVNSLHPGVVGTRIWLHAPWYALPFLAVLRLVMLSPAAGADRILHLSTSPDVEGMTGGYYETYRLVEPSRLARDEALARQLWDVSAQMVKLAPAGCPVS